MAKYVHPHEFVSLFVVLNICALSVVLFDALGQMLRQRLNYASSSVLTQYEPVISILDPFWTHRDFGNGVSERQAICV